jgi:nucleotide-binding universal stress UspA family protein
MFDCVVGGVDATPESLDACRQAARLRRPGGSLFLVAAADVRAAAQAGFEAVYATDQIRDEAGEALARAKETVQGHAQGLVVEGSAVSALLDVAVREEATLIAVGAQSWWVSTAPRSPQRRRSRLPTSRSSSAPRSAASWRKAGRT